MLNISWEYSENKLVQDSAGNVLRGRLGWDVVYAFNTESLGDDSILGHKSYLEILLTRYLRAALFERNDWMTEELCGEVIKKLLATVSSDTLMQINENKYLLTAGRRSP